MEYKNSEIKIDALVSYLNEDKINLSPAFQRGHVWGLGTRQKLLKNIVSGKPIPSVFLYKEAAGSKYSYNILDGKQRIESIILFIGSQREDLKIVNWERYFFEKSHKRHGNFSIELDEGEKKAFMKLKEELIRDFREYAIPAIEISLDDDSSLDEIISLFVDINQQGEAVKRFDIVKALCKEDKTLRATFKLIAQEERRGQDIFYKMINNDVTYILKRLQIVAAAEDNKCKVDRMWEKLLELTIFEVTKQHRKPVEILKGFISRKAIGAYKIRKSHLDNLRKVFSALKPTYANSDIATSRLAADQTHFYTLATSLLNSSLISDFAPEILTQKLASFANIIEGKSSPPSPSKKDVSDYLALSQKQTTDTVKRQGRERLFIKIMAAL